MPNGADSIDAHSKAWEIGIKDFFRREWKRVTETDTPEPATNAIEQLAARLYFNSERLDPSLGPDISWPELPEHNRQFWRALVTDLLRFEELVRVVIYKRD